MRLIPVGLGVIAELKLTASLSWVPQATDYREIFHCLVCDRGCLCVIHAQLIWLIRPKSHCRNQRQTEHFEKCANRTLSGLCGCEVVVLLNFAHHHIWILFGRCFQCQWIFGCASQVDAVASTLTQVFGCLALRFGLLLHLKSVHGVSENSFSFVVVVDPATWHKTSGFVPPP